jgi:hypothetical protein
MINKRPTPTKFSSPISRGDTGLELGGLIKTRERWTLKSSLPDEYIASKVKKFPKLEETLNSDFCKI